MDNACKVTLFPDEYQCNPAVKDIRRVIVSQNVKDKFINSEVVWITIFLFSNVFTYEQSGDTITILDVAKEGDGPTIKLIYDRDNLGT